MNRSFYNLLRPTHFDLIIPGATSIRGRACLLRFQGGVPLTDGTSILQSMCQEIGLTCVKIVVINLSSFATTTTTYRQTVYCKEFVDANQRKISRMPTLITIPIITIFGIFPLHAYSSLYRVAINKALK